MNPDQPRRPYFLWGALILIVLLVAAGAYGGYRYRLLSKDYALRVNELASTTADLSLLNDEYTNQQSKNAQLAAQLQEAQDQNTSFGSQISAFATTVGSLSKLAATDPELLEKYSKVYFLSDNYVPAKLSNIDPSYVFGTKTLQFQSDALPFLTKMMDDANAAGSNLRVISAYRSFGTQALLKSSYNVTYGAGTANSFSADQGYSEHQLGTAIDFTNTTLGNNFSQFNGTVGFNWLMANAYKYGFILSYPKDNTYYVYEPWHWRFVGVKLAAMLHAENEEFYQLDQRTISAYLVSIFDPINLQN